jgi:hypothetical protein
MATPEEIRRSILEQIARLQADERRDYEDTLRLYDQGNASQQQYLNLLRDIQRRTDDLSRSLESIGSILTDNVNELKNQNEYINRAVSSSRKLSNISS